MGMRTLEMKIPIPEIKGGRLVCAELKNGYISAQIEFLDERIMGITEQLEFRIDPNQFEGEWLKYKLNDFNQNKILDLYEQAKKQERLHSFTCVMLEPSIVKEEVAGIRPTVEEKVVCNKNVIPTVTTQKTWSKILKGYNPARNSRQMTITEFICFTLFLVKKYINEGYTVSKAWELVWKEKNIIGGSRPKVFSNDLRDEEGSFWSVDGWDMNSYGELCPAGIRKYSKESANNIQGISLISMD